MKVMNTEHVFGYSLISLVVYLLSLCEFLSLCRGYRFTILLPG